MKKQMEFAEIPYKAYKVSKVWHKKQGRFYACLYPLDKALKRTSISWARYLMSVHLGRRLLRQEHVDHINNIKSDDRIENLQILTPAENNKKSAKGRTFVQLVCNSCGNHFYREKRQVRTGNVYCNKICLAAYLTTLTYKKEIIHGTKNSYSYHRCRCVACTEAHRVAYASWKAKRNTQVYHESIIY